MDLDSKFIHLSTKKQVSGTIEKYFNKEKYLFIVKFETSDLGRSLKWERSRNSDLFPHYYGVLEFNLVKEIQESAFHEF